MTSPTRAGLPVRATQPVMPSPTRSLSCGGVRRQALRGMDFQEAVGGIDEDHRAARGAHQPHRFLEDQLQRLLGIEGRVNHVADLVQRLATGRNALSVLLIRRS